MTDALAPNATRSLVFERALSHPPEKVWRALTQGPLMEEWLMKNDFEPTAGRRFNLRSQPNPHWNGVVDCQVLEIEPPRRLAFSWDSSGEEAADGMRTVVTIDLTPTAAGTLMRLEHSGFREADGGFYQGAGYGWPKMLDSLESVIDRL